MRFVTALGIVCAPIALLIGRTVMHERDPDSNLNQFRTYVGVHQLADAVESYRAHYGELPATLDSLAGSLEASLAEPISEGDLIDPFGRAYRYERTASAIGFRVFTLGRDDETGGDGSDRDQSAP